MLLSVFWVITPCGFVGAHLHTSPHDVTIRKNNTDFLPAARTTNLVQENKHSIKFQESVKWLKYVIIIHVVCEYYSDAYRKLFW
jgi:hypothetical protein